jgi:uncharacterized membrane protein
MAKTQVSKSGDDKILFAFLAAFLSIIGFIIALVAKKEDRYVMFYAKQSLVIFIAYVIAGIIWMIPLIGWFVLGPIAYLFVTIMWIISWVYALSGEEKEVPVLGKYAQKFNL